jgi:hypothetical protein
MRFLKFADFSINEAEIKPLSELDQFKPIALGVAEVFSLFGYFISLATEKIEESDNGNKIDHLKNTVPDAIGE